MIANMTELEWLIAIEQIKMLKGKRIYAFDNKDWATYEALHAHDHYSDNPEDGRRWDGAKANTDRLAKLLHAGVTTVHQVHSPYIELTAADAAKGVWSLEDNLYWRQQGEEHWLHGFGFYHETYAKRDGRWLFTSRQLRRIKVLTSQGALLHLADPA